MSPRSEFSESGYAVSLGRDLIRPLPPAEQIDIASAVLAGLSPILQPISLDLIVGCTYADSVLDDLDTTPPERAFHLRQDPPPPGHTPRARGGDAPRVARAPALDPATVAAWLREPLSQRIPDRATSIDTLRMNDGRARLCSPDLAARPTFEIYDGPARYEVTVEERADGKWVSGPTPELIYPPIAFSLTQAGGTISCDLHVHWTRWATPGTAEYDTFCACVRALLGASWKILYLNDVFSAGVR